MKGRFIMSNKSNYQNKGKDSEYQSKSKNYKGKGNNKRTQYKNDEREESYKGSKDVASYVGQSNDPQWYFKVRPLVEKASKIPFSNQLGRKLSWSPNVIENMPTKDSNAITGIMGIDMVLAPGIATMSNDGVNIAAANTFQYIRKNIATTASYAAADVMMYILGIDSIYAMYSYITRLFGIVNAWSATNLYMPDALITAGYKFDDGALSSLRRNYLQYENRFNQLVYKASTLYLPVDFSITSRHSWLCSNYFWDSNNTKAQIYIHHLEGVHYLDETSSIEGTQLTATLVENSTEQLLNQFNTMIERYRNSDSMLKIAADMRRAYEGKTSWSLAYVDENYICMPMIDDTVLSQIQNMNVWYNPNIDAQFNITQSVDKNIVLYQPKISLTGGTPAANINANIMCGDHVLNTYYQDPTPEAIVEMTRDVFTGELSSDGTEAIMSSCGADFCIGLNMFKRTSNGTIDYIQLSEGNYIPTVGGASKVAQTLSGYSMFDWAPLMYLADGITSTDHLYLYGDLSNYTTVDSGTIENLNNVVICSMWDVPEFGSTVK